MDKLQLIGQCIAVVVVVVVVVSLLLKYMQILTIQNESMRISTVSGNWMLQNGIVTLRWLWQLMISAVCDWREATRSLHVAIWWLDETMYTLSSKLFSAPEMILDAMWASKWARAGARKCRVLNANDTDELPFTICLSKSFWPSFRSRTLKLCDTSLFPLMMVNARHHGFQQPKKEREKKKKQKAL